jgi:hypothetical protein
MKFLLIAWLVGTWTLRVDAQQPSLRPIRLRDTLLARVLVEGEEVRLPSYGKRSPPILLRLWRVGREGSCVKGTEALCSYQYYVAAGDYGEEAPIALYSLGEVGELTSFKWLPRPAGEAIALGVTAVNWPTTALKAERTLKRRARAFNLVVSTDSIRIWPTP